MTGLDGTIVAVLKKIVYVAIIFCVFAFAAPDASAKTSLSEKGRTSPKAGQISPLAGRTTPKASKTNPLSGNTNPEASQTNPVVGQWEEMSLTIYFKVGRYELLPSLSGNGRRISRFFEALDSLSIDPAVRISHTVDIRSSASPEGNTQFNAQLSMNRARTAMELFRSRTLSNQQLTPKAPAANSLSNNHLSPKAPAAKSLSNQQATPNALDGISFRINSIGEDWETLGEQIRSSNLDPSRKALDIVEKTPTYIIRHGKIVGGRKQSLMNLWGGKLWWKLYRLFFPSLRQATLTVRYTRQEAIQSPSAGALTSAVASSNLPPKGLVQKPTQIPTQIPTQRPTQKPSQEPSQTQTPEPSPAPSQTPDLQTLPTVKATAVAGKKPLFAIKTNLLFDAATLINLAIELPVSERVSIAAEGIFPWWRNASKDITIQMMAADIEGKYWFGDRSRFEAMTGFYAGAYFGGGIFDFQLGKLTDGKGVQGDFFILGGLSAGYAHKIGRNLRLEYGLGLEYLQCDFREYISVKDTKFGNIKVMPYPWELKRSRSILPTKASVSLVWMIDSRKGGPKK